MLAIDKGFSSRLCVLLRWAPCLSCASAMLFLVTLVTVSVEHVSKLGSVSPSTSFFSFQDSFGLWSFVFTQTFVTPYRCL